MTQTPLGEPQTHPEWSSLAVGGAGPPVGGSWPGGRSHTQEGCPNFYFIFYFDFHSCSCPLANVILGCGESKAAGMGTLGEGFGGDRHKGSYGGHKGDVGDGSEEEGAAPGARQVLELRHP